MSRRRGETCSSSSSRYYTALASVAYTAFGEREARQLNRLAHIRWMTPKVSTSSNASSPNRTNRSKDVAIPDFYKILRSHATNFSAAIISFALRLLDFTFRLLFLFFCLTWYGRVFIGHDTVQRASVRYTCCILCAYCI